MIKELVPLYKGETNFTGSGGVCGSVQVNDSKKDSRYFTNQLKVKGDGNGLLTI